jgi:hypothetical protein
MSSQDSVTVSKSVPVIAQVDVLVVGSGIAGSTAAVTAARSGAKTMVVDRFGYPGGNMGPGLIGGAPNLELPESMAEQGMPGIPGEFVRRCEAYAKGQLLNHYFRDANIVSHVWLEMMQESGVELLFNTYAGDPIMEGNRVKGLLVESKSGTQAILAKVVVDATGDADVGARAGAPVDSGASLFNPGMYLAIGNVDIETYEMEVARVEPGKDDVRWAKDLGALVGKRLEHLKPLIPYYRRAWESGEYRFLKDIGDRWTILLDHGIFASVSGVQVVPDPIRRGRYGILGALVGVWGPWDDGNAETSGSAQVMNMLEMNCRMFAFETVQFCVRRLPGFKDAYLHFVSPYFHARGGRSIVSEHPITRVDIDKEPLKDDVVFIADEHTIPRRPDGKVTGAEVYGYKQRRTFDFPYRQLLPRKVEGLLAAGRSAIIQPPVMRVRWMVFLMGQAAGVAAALAAKRNLIPRELDVKELQRVLHVEYQVPLGDRERLEELGLV